jgi:hypothetical protein
VCLFDYSSTTHFLRCHIQFKTFSDDIRSLTNHFKPDVELFEYVVLKKENERELYFHPVSPPKIEEMHSEPTKNYL